MIREEEGSQRLIYFTSRVLQGEKVKYHKLEKLVYVVVISAKKLHPYFQTHTITILTDQPLCQVLQSSKCQKG